MPPNRPFRPGHKNHLMTYQKLYITYIHIYAKKQIQCTYSHFVGVLIDVLKCHIQQYFSYIVTGHSHSDSKFWPAAWHQCHGQLRFFSVPSLPWHGSGCLKTSSTSFTQKLIQLMASWPAKSILHWWGFPVGPKFQFWPLIIIQTYSRLNLLQKKPNLYHTSIIITTDCHIKMVYMYCMIMRNSHPLDAEDSGLDRRDSGLCLAVAIRY